MNSLRFSNDEWTVRRCDDDWYVCELVSMTNGCNEREQATQQCWRQNVHWTTEKTYNSKLEILLFVFAITPSLALSCVCVDVYRCVCVWKCVESLQCSSPLRKFGPFHSSFDRNHMRISIQNTCIHAAWILFQWPVGMRMYMCLTDDIPWSFVKSFTVQLQRYTNWFKITLHTSQLSHGNLTLYEYMRACRSYRASHRTVDGLRSGLNGLHRIRLLQRSSKNVENVRGKENLMPKVIEKAFL